MAFALPLARLLAVHVFCWSGNWTFFLDWDKSHLLISKYSEFRHCYIHCSNLHRYTIGWNFHNFHFVNCLPSVWKHVVWNSKGQGAGHEGQLPWPAACGSANSHFALQRPPSRLFMDSTGNSHFCFSNWPLFYLTSAPIFLFSCFHLTYCSVYLNKYFLSEYISTKILAQRAWIWFQDSNKIAEFLSIKFFCKFSYSSEVYESLFHSYKYFDILTGKWHSFCCINFQFFMF